MKKVAGLAALGLAVGLLATPALAGGRTIHRIEASTVNTNWGNSFNPLVAPQHDPALGQLTKVFICVRGRASRHFRVESLDSQPSSITISNLNSGVLFQQPCNPSQVITSTRATYPNLAFALAAHDGTVDYAGPSGFDSGVMFRGFGPVLIDIVSPSIDCFVGTGDIELPIEIEFTSDISGPGNLFIETRATCTIRGVIIYEYV